ncbi:MAG: hypothetical protein HOI95_16875 [Chromatiales bacterium]|nr:hypothetical protein [Chromatiales bacterium]
MFKQLPRGVLVVTCINLALIVLFGGNLFVFYSNQATQTYVFVSSWIAVTGLLAVLSALVVRSALWHKLARISLYVMSLCFGVQVMGMLGDMGHPATAGGIVGLLLVVFYLFGVRGYLNSSVARSWFHLPPLPDQSQAEPGNTKPANTDPTRPSSTDC